MDRRRNDRRSHDDRQGAERRLVVGAGLLGAAAVAAVALVFAGAGRAVGPVCKTSGPAGGSYTATLCVSTPGSGATISGATPVTATVAFSGTTPPGVQRVTFYLDGLYLITDYSAPYTFTLPSERHIDGSHVLEAESLLRSAFTTSRVATPLTFANGVTTPLVNTRTFTLANATPAAGKPLVVAAAGDGAGGSQSEADVVGLIKSWNPNLFLYLGDVYEDGSPTEFTNWYGAPVTPMLSVAAAQARSTRVSETAVAVRLAGREGGVASGMKVVSARASSKATSNVRVVDVSPSSSDPISREPRASVLLKSASLAPSSHTSTALATPSTRTRTSSSYQRPVAIVVVLVAVTPVVSLRYASAPGVLIERLTRAEPVRVRKRRRFTAFAPLLSTLKRTR